MAKTIIPANTPSEQCRSRQEEDDETQVPEATLTNPDNSLFNETRRYWRQQAPVPR